MTHRYLIALGLLAVCFLVPFFVDPFQISLNDDWTQIFAFQAFLTDQIWLGHIPHRSHMLGGGFPIIAHPEYPILSPLSAPVLLFGPVLGTKINVAIIYLLGLWGMWLLCRHTLELDEIPASYATASFATMGWIPAILMSGNYPQIYYLCFPMLAYLVLGRKWFDKKLVGGALLATTMMLDGHLNTVCCFLILGLWAAIQGRDHIVRFVAVMTATVGLSAFKLAPTLMLLLREDRSIDDYSNLELASFRWEIFAGWTPDVEGFALGVVPWLLALTALVAWKKSLRLVVIHVVAWILWLGPQSPIDLFGLLHALPIIKSIDAPSKYFVFFIGFTAIVLGAIALNEYASKLPRTALWIFVVAACAPLLVLHQPLMGNIFDESDVPSTQRKYVQIDADYFVTGEWNGATETRPDLYLYYRQGIAIARWEDNFKLPLAVTPAWIVQSDGTQQKHPDYIGESWFNGSKAPVKLSSISSNEIEVIVDERSGDTVVINQRFDTGWTCNNHPPIDVAGQLGVPATAIKEDRIKCSYTSAPLIWGSAISGLSLLILLAGLRFRGQQPIQSV